ncbi:hypothetical protein CHLRE_02g143047v5 [Chlamydomonas reinhardtii]|uniref:Uncharacterized protein n=1 Tax=Chlamydomonas reinhardtii TaxID=3055 RepID=A0A2K3E4N9_CHLRE|nr:uncharacterized protein CHLRE_02g143047v5 [Chlamydomonas reinhardtii]PNW87697.1 hypothetical protein CHLRE_02g143047v5 [Chlamydomonas reinhardtii]
MGKRRGWCVGHGSTTNSTAFHALEPVEEELAPSWCMGACSGTVRWGKGPLDFTYVLHTNFPSWKEPTGRGHKCNLCTGCVKDAKKAEEEANQIYGTVAVHTDPTSSCTARAFSSPAGVAVDARNGVAVVHVNNSSAETFVRLPLPAVHTVAGTLAAAVRRPGGKGAGTAAVPATHFNAAAHALANAVTANPPALEKPSVVFSGSTISPAELLVHWAVAQSKGPVTAAGTCSNSVELTDLSRNVFWWGVASAVKSLFGTSFSPDSLRGWHERLTSSGGGRVPVPPPPPLPPQSSNNSPPPEPPVPPTPILAEDISRVASAFNNTAAARLATKLIVATTSALPVADARVIRDTLTTVLLPGHDPSDYVMMASTDRMVAISSDFHGNPNLKLWRLEASADGDFDFTATRGTWYHGGPVAGGALLGVAEAAAVMGATSMRGVATRTEDPDTPMTEIFGYTMQQQEQQQQQPRRTRTGLGDITNLLPLQQQALQPRQAKRARA